MAKRCIALLGGDKLIQNEDDKAAEAITPGHLVAFNGSGDLVKHATAGGSAVATFALERDELGKTIDTAYAIGDTVKVGSFGKGHRVLAFIPSGHGIVKGNYLESNGDGTLRLFASGQRIARALETVANGAAATAARIRSEVV